MTIEELALTIDIVGNNITKTYNGSEQNVSGYTATNSSSLFNESNVSYSGNDTAARTDVGTTYMNLTAADFSYSDTNINATFNVSEDGYITIEGLDLTIEITGHNATLEYNGSKQTVTGYTAVNSSSLFNASNVSYRGNDTAARSDVGTTDMNLDASQFSYSDPGINATFSIAEDGYMTITPLNVTVTITGNRNNVDLLYNGREQSVSGYTFNATSDLFTEDDIDFSGSDTAAGTNAGTYTAELNADDFDCNNENFNVSYEIAGSVEITISPRKVTITSGTASKEYDGTPLTNDNVTVSGDGFVNGELPVYTFTGSQTNAGTSENTFTVTFAESEGGLSGSGLRGMAETRDPTALKINYEAEEVFGNLTVDPKEVTVTADDKTKKRNTTDPELTVTIEGLIDGESEDLISYEIERESGEDSGTYVIYVTGDEKQGNYIVTFIDGTMTIGSGYIINATTSI